MWSLVLVCSLLANAEVTVRPLSGTPVTGELLKLDTDQLVVRAADGEKQLATRDILAIAVDADATPPDDLPVAWIELRDGTQLQAGVYSVKGRQATIRLLGGAELQLPTSAVRSVRFRMPSAALDPQWREIGAAKASGDVVVIRKTDEALDQLEGAIRDIDGGKVQFEFDDAKIPVDIGKLEGLYYLQPAGTVVSEPRCRVGDRLGNRWLVQTIALSGSDVRLQTGSGAQVTLPLDQIQAIDFSSGNVAFLSDLEPESQSWVPFLGSGAVAESLNRLYAPRRDASFDGGKLQLAPDGKITEFDKGLAIHSRSTLVYRLTDNFRRLTALVGIDHRMRGQGHVELVISGDDKELFRGVVRGTDAPLPLDLDIQGVRRLKIIVDFGEQLDIADHLNLCEARIIK